MPRVRSAWRASTSVFLLAAIAIVYLAPLGLRPMVSPDEPRYGEIAREMLATCDWIVPRLVGVRYFEKPVLGYWLQATSLAAFGPSPFALRLPSALATLGSAALVFALLRRTRRASGTALLGAIAYSTSILVFIVGQIAVLDAMFALFVLAAWVAFYLGRNPLGPGRTALQIAFGAAAGLAFLTKGLLAFALLGLVIVPFLAWERRLRELWTAFWLPGAVAIAVVLPWALAIHAREPDFWRYFLVVENVQRFLGASRRQHPAPLWFYLPILLGGALPWSFFLPVIGRARWRDPLVRFAGCAVAFPFLFFSLSSGKLPTYILPCFAPLAILIALGFAEGRASRERWLGSAGRAMAALAGAAAIALLAVQTPWLAQAGAWDGWTTPRWMSLLVGLSCWVALSVRAARQAGSPERAVRAYAAAPLLVMLVGPCALPPMEGRMPGAFLEAQRSLLSPETRIVTDNRTFQAVAWQYARSDLVLLGLGELEYGLGHPDAEGRLLDRDALRSLIEDPSRRESVALIVKQSFYAWLALPIPSVEVENGFLTFALFPGPAAAHSLAEAK